MSIMVRQCAWCLRLIDNLGVPVSKYPRPKMYEATHGMCKDCGVLWLEAVMHSGNSAAPAQLQEPVMPEKKSEYTGVEEERSSSIPEFPICPTTPQAFQAIDDGEDRDMPVHNDICLA